MPDKVHNAYFEYLPFAAVDGTPCEPVTSFVGNGFYTGRRKMGNGWSRAHKTNQSSAPTRIKHRTAQSKRYTTIVLCPLGFSIIITFDIYIYLDLRI